MKKKNYHNRTVILYLIDFLASKDGLTGGTERQLVEMLNHLDQSKFRAILFCLKDFPQTFLWDDIKCEKHILHVSSLVSLHGIRAFFSLLCFLRRHSVDIVQTYFHDSTMFGILAARLALTRIAISCRRDMGFWYDKSLLRNMSFVNRVTNRVLANCNAVKNAVVLHEHLPDSKIDVIHNGFDLEKFDNHSSVNLMAEFSEIRKGDLIIGMVANYNRGVKRADLFIRAAAEVARHNDHVKFLLIGGGKLENELKGLVSQLGLQDRFIIGGKREPATPYIKSFDIGVITSDSEGFSNVLLEYMAAGIPVVATDVGGNAEIVPNKSLGLLVPRGDHNALAHSLCTLLNNDKRREEMGRNSRNNIVENYSWARKIKEIERYYASL